MRLLPDPIMNLGTRIPTAINRFIFNVLRELQFPEQHQDQQYDQNDADQARSGMAHAIAVPAEPAAEAAQQRNDQNDDEYRSKRHQTLPKQGGIRRPA